MMGRDEEKAAVGQIVPVSQDINNGVSIKASYVLALTIEENELIRFLIDH